MTKPNHTPTIKAIFTNLLFVIGIILMVFGFVWGTSTVAKLAFFEKYPLESYEEGRCEMGYFPEPVKDPNQTDEQRAEAKAQMEKQQAQCRKEVEHRRSVKKVEDSVTSVSLFVAGLALSLVFKQFIWQKK
jgi:hypothetical protein